VLVGGVFFPVGQVVCGFAQGFGSACGCVKRDHGYRFGIARAAG